MASNGSGAGSGKKYQSVYGLADPRLLKVSARKNVETGELMVKWMAKTQEALGRYQGEHGRSGAAASGIRASAKTQERLAKNVFSTYIRYALAQDLHGVAAAEAPRKPYEFSQTVEVEESSGFFGKSITTTIVKGGLKNSDEQAINAIVSMYPEAAAEYGLTEGGANLGPNVNEAAAKARIAAEGGENADKFAGGARRKGRKGRKTRKARKGRKTRKGKSRKGRKGTRRH